MIGPFLARAERASKRISINYAEANVTRAPDLPDFDFPPIVEVVLGVQFEPLAAFGSSHLAILADRWRDQFPTWEEQPPLQPVKEWFGVPGQPSVNIRFDVGPLPPLRRAFFFDEKHSELRQVQADRFVRNWQKTVDPYPHYDDRDSGDSSLPGLRSRFRDDLLQFVAFVKEQGLGDFLPNQCEITYVNHIPVHGEAGARDLAELLAPWRGSFADDFLPAPESIELAMHFVITDDTGNKVGRLHIAAAPAHDHVSGEAMTRLTLTCRGIPLGKGVDGVLRFLDLGRRYIVKGFASTTAETMHNKWRRKDGG